MVIGKKGQMVKFLVGFIVLVISAVAIFILLGNFGLKSGIDKEACHQSILVRATAPGDLSKSAPLNCKTEKLCLSMSGNDCGLAGSKDNPVKKINLGKNPEKAREKVIEILGDNLISCHSMLGEGKLKFFSSDWFGEGEQFYGLICNRIVFDDLAKEEIEPIKYSSLYSYLETRPVGDESALEYLYPGWKSSRDSSKLYRAFQDDGIGDEDGVIKDIDFVDWVMDLERKNGYAIVAMQAVPGQFNELLGTGIAVGGVIAASVASVVFLPVGLVSGATILAVGTASGFATGGAVLWYNYDDEYRYAAPAIIPYEVEALQSLGVNSFEIAP